MKKILFLFFILLSLSGFAAEKVDPGTILADQEWRIINQDYVPDPLMIETLAAKVGDNLEIDVYFGFWCSDSRNNVPVFMKIADEVAGNTLEIDYYSVERKPSKEVKYFVEDLKIERVPTFIFYRDGKEIGRIIENPKVSILEDFLEIVFN